LANPQADKFVKLSNELYEAIMQSDFSKRQRNVLDLIIRMSYGCGKTYAILKMSDFEVVGVLRTNIKKEIELLKRASVIKVDGQKIELNKDYDKWRISLVSSFDPEKFKKVLHRNLTDKKSYQNDNQTDDRLSKQELDSYQNDNPTVIKTITDTSLEASNTNEFQPPKDSIKESIKDINNKDIYMDESMNLENSPIKKIEDHYMQKQIEQRGIGVIPSPSDFSAMQRLLDAKVPLEDILSGIDHAFKYYKPKHSRDRINSFAYCESVILDQHARKQARENVKRESVNYDESTRGTGSNTKPADKSGKWDAYVIS
jgi:hypothetical protein